MDSGALAALFGQVQQAFAQKGLLGQGLRLSHQGRTFRVRCDQSNFTVYQVNEQHHLPPGLPGWTVCRLSAAEVFCGKDGGPDPAPESSQMEQAQAWVEMVLASLAG